MLTAQSRDRLARNLEAIEDELAADYAREHHPGARVQVLRGIVEYQRDFVRQRAGTIEQLVRAAAGETIRRYGRR